MNIAVNCKVDNVKVIKEYYCNPDWNCEACPRRKDIATRPNYKIDTKNRKHKLQPLAECYFKNPEKLPYPLNQPDAVIDIDYKKYPSSKILKELSENYSEDTIKKIYCAFSKFNIAIFRFDNALKTMLFKKSQNKKIGIAIGILESVTMRNSDNILLQLKKDLIKENVEYTPENLLENWGPFAPIVSFKKGNPGQPFYKVLQIVIFKMLKNTKSERLTEAFTAKIINDYFHTCKQRISVLEKISAKDINNARYLT